MLPSNPSCQTVVYAANNDCGSRKLIAKTKNGRILNTGFFTGIRGLVNLYGRQGGAAPIPSPPLGAQR